MVDPEGVYKLSEPGERLHQGEVLAPVIERQVGLDGEGEQVLEFEHKFVVVLTQDCDLEQDFRARAEVIPDGPPAEREAAQIKRENGVLHHVLLAVATTANVVKGRVKTDRNMEKVLQNKDERYQYLAGSPVGGAFFGREFGPLVLDFKRVFSYPLDQLRREMDACRTRRLAYLTTPYAEQLCVRFGYFCQRIALPQDHARITRVQQALPGPGG